MTAFDSLGHIGPLTDLGHSLEHLAVTVALCSIRLGVAMTVLPATGEQFVQGMIRAGLTLVFGSFIAFGLPMEPVMQLSVAQWLGLAAKEAMIGLMMGFSVATVFWIAECVGALMDTQTGYNNVQLSNPMSGQESTPISGMLLQLVTAVFYVLGGMLLFLGAMFESFKVWPITASLPSLTGASEVFLFQLTDSLMVGTVKFAAPVLLILVLIDLGLGLITRAADKLEPSSLAQPIKGAVTMLLLALLIGIFVDQVRRLLLPTDLLPRMQNLLPS
jgi:type III secretion protein T